MSRDVITVGSTMRILLLYQGEYSQWRERFMNYLEEQTNGEAMINSIQNEKKTRKIDRLARSLLIQGLPNDIYSLIDSYETTKDLWDALARHMLSSEYGEQDRKAAILYEYETFKDIEGDQLLDTYLCYLQVINDLKKCGYKKENYCKKVKVKDYEYYKTKMLLAKKDKDEQVLLAEDQAWIESSSDSNQEINANMVFMAQIKKVIFDSEASSSSADEKIFEEKNNKFNDQIKVLNEKNVDLLAQMKVLKDQLQVKHVVIDTHVECHEKYAKLEEERYEYMLRYSTLFDNDKQHRKQIAESEYVTVSIRCAQVIWMRTQLTGYGFFYDKVPIYCDSKNAIAISCNLISSKQTRAINDSSQVVSEPGALDLGSTSDTMDMTFIGEFMKVQKQLGFHDKTFMVLLWCSKVAP
nr:ribonuclease H-like domain-containing protein [Tanacetum cinerariifolium]